MIYLVILMVLFGLALFSPEIWNWAKRLKLEQIWAHLLIWWAPRRKAVSKTLKIITVFMVFAQAISFMLFMYEEALQTVMFATWAAPPGTDRTALATTYRKILDAAWATLYTVGWANPLAWGPYRAYFEAAETWYVNAYRRTAP